MLRSILVGLDGSIYCAAAVELAVQLAERTGALVGGIGVIDEPTICAGEAMPLGGITFKQFMEESRLADARMKVKRWLKSFEETCELASVAHRETEAIGLPFEQIVLEAQRYDMILLGQHTFFHFETEQKPGDTLRKVLERCPRPVVAVPEKLRGGGGVMVAYDASIQAARAVQALQWLGLADSEQVHVVSVDRDWSTAQRQAEIAAEFLRTHEIDARPVPVASSGSPADVILNQLNETNERLLVIGAYGKPTFREFFLGSVTRKVLGHCPVPVLLYH